MSYPLKKFCGWVVWKIFRLQGWVVLTLFQFREWVVFLGPPQKILGLGSPKIIPILYGGTPPVFQIEPVLPSETDKKVYGSANNGSSQLTVSF